MRLRFIVLLVPLTAHAQWAFLTNTPSIKIQALLLDVQHRLWVTEANNNTNTGGAWRTQSAGSSITTGVGFDSMISGTPTVGDMALNCSGEVVAESHSLSASHLYRWVGNAAPPTDNGPSGKDWVHLARDPTGCSLYVMPHSCITGVYTSTDGGTTWSSIGFTITGGICDDIAVNPVNGHAVGTSEASGTYQWDGASWTQAVDDTCASPAIRFMPGAPNAPTTDKTMWMCQNDVAYVRPTQFSGALTPTTVTIVSGHQYRYRGLVGVNDSTGAACSTSTGCTWYICGKDNSTGFPDVSKSTDNGATWSRFNSGFPITSAGQCTAMAYDVSSGNLFVGADGVNGGVYIQNVATVPPSGGGSGLGGKLTLGGAAVLN